MSNLQEIIDEKFIELADLLNSDETSSALLCSEAFDFWGLIEKLWRELPLTCEQGSALATASCIFLWEVLHFFSGLCSSLPVKKRAFALNFLTALISKSKDRRCTYQQLNYKGSEAMPVPLSVTLPVSSEMVLDMRLGKASSEVFLSCSTAFLEYFGHCENGKIISERIRFLIFDVLPNCTISVNQNSGKGGGLPQLQIYMADNFTVSWNSFCGRIWKYIVIAEIMNISEGRELSVFLLNSAWSSKVVMIDGKNATYRSLFTGLVDSSMICLSLNGRLPSINADNTPLIDPRIIGDFLRQKKIFIQEEIGKLRALKKKMNSRKHCLGEFLINRKCGKLRKTLFVDVPSAVKKIGSSSLCRDCDRLTMLCRDCIFTIFPLLNCRAVGKKRALYAALFDRKRSRDSRMCAEGPSFLPIEASLTDLWEDTTSSYNTLERLSVSWCEK